MAKTGVVRVAGVLDYETAVSHNIIVRATSADGSFSSQGFVIAVGVFSHFVMDFVTHRPDLPLFPGSPTSVGLGLWNSRPATLATEVALFVLGVAVYARTTRASNRRGAIAFWALVVFLAVFYAMNFFGPPPPSVDVIKYGGLTGWLFVPWAWWIDRNRELRSPVA